MTKETHHGDPDPVGARSPLGTQAGFHGTLLRPGQRGYEEARAVWNGMIDKHPRARGTVQRRR